MIIPLPLSVAHAIKKSRFMSKRVEAVRKPNSVPEPGYPDTGNDHSSMDAGYPASLATYPETRAGNPQTFPYLVLHRVGFTELPGHRGTGALLPHLFTLTPPYGGAVYFLLHFPSRCRDSTLWSTLPCGVRTFLEINPLIPRSFKLLRPDIVVFPIYDPVTVRAKLQTVKTLKLIIPLGWNIHVTSQANRINGPGDGDNSDNLFDLIKSF